jgi:hypothetical protein
VCALGELWRGADVRTTTTTVSVGQQLIDLKKACDSGSVTQAEYAALELARLRIEKNHALAFRSVVANG